MPGKLGSGTKEILDDLKTALDRLLAARMYLRSARANNTMAQVSRTLRISKRKSARPSAAMLANSGSDRPVNRRSSLQGAPERNWEKRSIIHDPEGSTRGQMLAL